MQGPGAYSTLSGIGKQPVSTRPSSALVRFGTSSRDHIRVDAIPGPGAYVVEHVDGIGGRPATSSRPRSATTRIGTGSRFNLASSASAGPGPAYSPLVTAVRPRSPQFSFGHESRDGKMYRTNPVPGPGTYDFNVDALGRRQATSVHPTVPRTKFGSSDRFHVPGGTPGAWTPAPGTYSLVDDPK